MVLLKNVCVHRAKRAAASAVLLAGKKKTLGSGVKRMQNFSYIVFLANKTDSFQISGFFLRIPLVSSDMAHAL